MLQELSKGCYYKIRVLHLLTDAEYWKNVVLREVSKGKYWKTGGLHLLTEAEYW